MTTLEIPDIIIPEIKISDAWVEKIRAVELPYDDGEPMETFRHVLQMTVLLDTIRTHWRDRNDFFAAGNMFLHFRLPERGQPQFRGPDFFLVKGVPSYSRKNWVVWEEGGRYPDLIVELLSETTAKTDLTEKKSLYESVFRTPEYICFDPYDPTQLLGWRISEGGRYAPIAKDNRGWLWSEELGLWFGLWEGEIAKDQALWLRMFTPEGELVLMGEEAAQREAKAAQREAEAAQREAEAAQREAEAAQREAEAAQRQVELERQSRISAEVEIARLRAELERLKTE